ncbi:MAG: hypothetical protein MZV63_23790 [Marinilabiliales bacterium]|nr:hypothetical protein [Marinilabiliales bacterium]
MRADSARPGTGAAVRHPRGRHHGPGAPAGRRSRRHAEVRRPGPVDVDGSGRLLLGRDPWTRHLHGRGGPHGLRAGGAGRDGGLRLPGAAEHHADARLARRGPEAG